jgi:hypothetical protein
MIDPVKQELVDVLRSACELARRPGNDFTWSTWDDADGAVMEISAYITTIEAGWLPPRMQMAVVFAATGPLQEVGLASGWGEEFRAIVARFEAAEVKVYERSTTR